MTLNTLKGDTALGSPATSPDMRSKNDLVTEKKNLGNPVWYGDQIGWKALQRQLTRHRSCTSHTLGSFSRFLFCCHRVVSAYAVNV